MSTCVEEVTNFLNAIKGTHILFPDNEEAQYANARTYYERPNGKPGCVGAVDGTHVAIHPPHWNENGFLNRKQYHSLNVMVSKLLRFL